MANVRTDQCPVMGLVEIAARLGVGKSWARQLANEAGFPGRWQLSAGDVWLRADVETWIARRFPDRADPPAPPDAGGGQPE